MVTADMRGGATSHADIVRVGSAKKSLKGESAQGDHQRVQNSSLRSSGSRTGVKNKVHLPTAEVNLQFNTQAKNHTMTRKELQSLNNINTTKTVDHNLASGNPTAYTSNQKQQNGAFFMPLPQNPHKLPQHMSTKIVGLGGGF